MIFEKNNFNKLVRDKIPEKITGNKIRVVRTAGVLTDAYSTRSKTVVISDETCETASVASLTIVAHEFGHALQDLTNSKKLKLNRTLTKTTKILVEKYTLTKLLINMLQSISIVEVARTGTLALPKCADSDN